MAIRAFEQPGAAWKWKASRIEETRAEKKLAALAPEQWRMLEEQAKALQEYAGVL